MSLHIFAATLAFLLFFFVPGGLAHHNFSCDLRWRFRIPRGLLRLLVELLLFNGIESLPARLRVRHRSSTFTARTTRSDTVLVNPSLRDVLPPDLTGSRGGTVWLWVCRSAPNAIQGVFVEAVTLSQPIDRSAAPDTREGSE